MSREHRLVAYDIPLRPDVMIRITLPMDLTTEDADRVAGFVRTLVFDSAAEKRGGEVMSWSIPISEVVQYIEATAEKLTTIAAEHPDWELTRNDVGNWSIYDKDGEYVGWVSPPQGQLDLLDEPGDLRTGRSLLDLWGEERARFGK